MPEYRGIVNPAEVKATPTFDWNTVIGNVQKSLTDSEAARQANRDKLEKDTNDTITAIGKVTLGKDEAMNKKLTDAAYNFKDLVGKNAQLVREGKMPQKDFNIFNQNLSDTFNTIDAVGKNAKKAYDSYIAESKAGNLSAASDYLAENLGLAMSLKNKNIIADPKTGRGFIIGTDPNDVIEINWLNNEKNLLVPKVKLDALMDANTDKIGKYALIGKVTSSGILSTDDAKERKGYEDYRKTVANGVISDPMGALSILTDYGDIDGKRYKPTIFENEAKDDPTRVYMKLNSTGNPEPVFTPKQLESAGKIIENQIDQRVNVITTQVEEVYRPTVFAPDRSGGYKAGEAPVLAPPAVIVETIGNKKRTLGQIVGIENVSIKKSPGVTEQLNSFGIIKNKQGKDVLFVDYTSYKGKESTKTEYGETSSSTASNVVEKKNRLYSDAKGEEFLGKLVLIPNPDTGKNFTGTREAQEYIARRAVALPNSEGGFDADAYYNKQKGKK